MGSGLFLGLVTQHDEKKKQPIRVLGGAPVFPLSALGCLLVSTLFLLLIASCELRVQLCSVLIPLA